MWVHKSKQVQIFFSFFFKDRKETRMGKKENTWQRLQALKTYIQLEKEREKGEGRKIMKKKKKRKKHDKHWRF